MSALSGGKSVGVLGLSKPEAAHMHVFYTRAMEYPRTSYTEKTAHLLVERSPFKRHIYTLYSK